ncbi:hypothetical protein AURDEDRAFT_167238 [Auricularia subglabra TFB-10046 SS5]|nr:hypothetical protein AURDEDRAFT_167238 [Auricularia subglabra TFB-10046 SS5]
MLLYQLGNLESLDPSFPERLEAALAGNAHLYLSNASGTGKTRMSFEILWRHWGLYLTCHADMTIDPYGSVDISQVASNLSRSWVPGTPFTSEVPLSTRPSQKSLDALNDNRRVARFFFRRLVLARMLVLKEFLLLASERNMPDDEARHQWLLIQLRSATLLGHDVFQGVLTYLQGQTDDVVTEIMATIPAEALARVSYIVIDEAQIALNVYRNAFSTTGDRRYAPLLRELIVCLGDFYPAARVVFSGVQFDIPVVSEALLQSRSYIRHFLGPTVSDGSCEMVYRWLQGRHRAIAALVMFTLRYGVRNIARVMDSMLDRMAGYQRPGCSVIKSYVFNSLGVIVKNEQLEASPAATVLRKAVMTYAVHHVPATTTRSCSRDLVHLALALYGVSAEEAVIFEPFIFLNLARWLSESATYGIHGVIRRRAIDDTAYPLHSVAFVEGLASCIMDSVHAAPSLDSVFTFPGRKPPWASHPGRLVLPHLARRRGRFTSVQSDNLAPIHCAACPADVFQWFQRAPQPFLIPDPEFGADLVFILEVHGGCNVLACVHTEPFSAFRGRRQNRVVPPDHESLYKREPEARAELLGLLKSLPPLPLDIDRPAGKPKPAKSSCKFAKFSSLHLLCFERPFRDEAYDPPAVNINFDYLLQLPRPHEVSPGSINAVVAHTPLSPIAAV